MRRPTHSDDSSEQLFPVLASETLRASHSTPVHVVKSGDEKVSLFWRIFGGTILSIVALLVVTSYQSISNSINDLRASVAHLNEAKAELLKKDEYSASRTRTWDRISELQKEISAVAAPLNTVKERVGQVEEHAKAHAAERKEIQTMQQALTALQEKSALRDQQIKQLEEERKETLKEIQSLRERLARVEATKERAKPSSKLNDPGEDK